MLLNRWLEHTIYSTDRETHEPIKYSSSGQRARWSSHITDRELTEGCFWRGVGGTGPATRWPTPRSPWRIEQGLPATRGQTGAASLTFDPVLDQSLVDPEWLSARVVLLLKPVKMLSSSTKFCFHRTIVFIVFK